MENAFPRVLVFCQWNDLKNPLFYKFPAFVIAAAARMDILCLFKLNIPRVPPQIQSTGEWAIVKRFNEDVLPVMSSIHKIQIPVHCWMQNLKLRVITWIQSNETIPAIIHLGQGWCMGCQFKQRILTLTSPCSKSCSVDRQGSTGIDYVIWVWSIL